MFSALNKWWFSIRAQDASWGRSPALCRACQWVMQPSPATCWLCDVLHIKSRKKYKIVQFSRSVVSDSLRPHESQHARPHCPSPTPGVHSNSCPSSRWCHPAILSSVIPFSCPQSFPASGSFPMSWFFISGGQKYWSFSFSVSPSNEYSGLISLRIDWFDLLAVWGTLRSLLQHHTTQKYCSAFFMVQLSHLYMTTGKTTVSLNVPLLAK